LARGQDQQKVETYLLPILLYIVLIACSFVIGSIKRQNFLAALGLIALLVVGAFLAQLFAARQLATRERSALFVTLSALAFSRRDYRQESSVLSETDVLSIEAAAQEVWVYAYDLKWEGPNDSPFTRMVRENLDRGVRYRYLVPRDEGVFNRVAQLRRSHTSTKNADKLMTFKASDRERTINQFGLTIYNPRFLSDVNASDSPIDTVVVFFPHYSDFASEGNRGEALFLSTRGQSTIGIQEAYVQTWSTATPVTGMSATAEA